MCPFIVWDHWRVQKILPQGICSDSMLQHVQFGNQIHWNIASLDLSLSSTMRWQQLSDFRCTALCCSSDPIWPQSVCNVCPSVPFDRKWSQPVCHMHFCLPVLCALTSIWFCMNVSVSIASGYLYKTIFFVLCYLYDSLQFSAGVLCFKHLRST